MIKGRAEAPLRIPQSYQNATGHRLVPFAVEFERRNRVLTLATGCADAPFIADNET